jgi:hypothetical protein
MCDCSPRPLTRPLQYGKMCVHGTAPPVPVPVPLEFPVSRVIVMQCVQLCNNALVRSAMSAAVRRRAGSNSGHGFPPNLPHAACPDP